jgi:hypothetical protein
MADYSYVTVEFALDDMTDDIELLASEAGTFQDRVEDEMLVAVEEARYGFPVPIGENDLAGDPLTADLVRVEVPPTERHWRSCSGGSPVQATG